MTNVLVTGGAGFIGSHLVERLLERGDTVRVIDNLSTGRAGNLAAVRQHPRLVLLEGDIGNPSLVAEALAASELILHLAAAVGVQLVAADPVRTIETNIGPTDFILRQAAIEHQAGKAKRVFVASSSEVYGKNPKQRWSEDDDLVWGPTTRLRWSYGASKAIDEFLAFAYHRQFGLPVFIGRFFNVVGPRQVGQYGMVLPRLVQAAKSGQPMVIHDDGQQTRCFAHVDDVTRAVLELVEQPAASGQVFNIGGDEPISILALAHLVAEVVGVPPQLEFRSYGEAYGRDFEDVRHRVPNVTRLRELLDWRPRHSLRDTIAAIAAGMDDRKRDV